MKYLLVVVLLTELPGGEVSVTRAVQYHATEASCEAKLSDIMHRVQERGLNVVAGCRIIGRKV
jgi:hypothetical protein